jgi:predicted ester cyclase
VNPAGFSRESGGLLLTSQAAEVRFIGGKEDAMKRLAQLVVATALLTTPLSASAQSLTEAQARAVIAPWYGLFNQPVQGDMKTLQEQVLTADYESCWGYLPGECWGRDASIKVVGGFAKSIPDMKFDIKEVIVAGDRVIVRGEVAGTPAGDLFGVPHTGKSFRIMAIDIQTIRDGKIARTYHVENWLSALGQLRAR